MRIEYVGYSQRPFLNCKLDQGPKIFFLEKISMTSPLIIAPVLLGFVVRTYLKDWQESVVGSNICLIGRKTTLFTH